MRHKEINKRLINFWIGTNLSLEIINLRRSERKRYCIAMTVDFTTWRNSCRKFVTIKSTAESHSIGVRSLHKLFFFFLLERSRHTCGAISVQISCELASSSRVACHFSGSENRLPRKQKEARERPRNSAYKYQQGLKKEERKLRCGTSARLSLRNIFETLSLIVTRIILLSTIKLPLICA